MSLLIGWRGTRSSRDQYPWRTGGTTSLLGEMSKSIILGGLKLKSKISLYKLKLFLFKIINILNILYKNVEHLMVCIIWVNIIEAWVKKWDFKAF